MGIGDFLLKVGKGIVNDAINKGREYSEAKNKFSSYSNSELKDEYDCASDTEKMAIRKIMEERRNNR